MAFEGLGDIWGFPAHADYSAVANQYKYVKLNTDGEAVVCDAVTDNPLGILQNKPKLGEMAQVKLWGISKVAANAALAVGDYVGTSVDGQAAVYVHGVDTTKYINGQVLGAAGAAGELATVVFNCVGLGRAA